jgi:hypothetical protein
MHFANLTAFWIVGVFFLLGGLSCIVIGCLGGDSRERDLTESRLGRIILSVVSMVMGILMTAGSGTLIYFLCFNQLALLR